MFKENFIEHNTQLNILATEYSCVYSCFFFSSHGINDVIVALVFYL